MSSIVSAIGFDKYYTGKEAILKRTLAAQVESAIKHGYTSFIYNQESKFGQWFAEAVVAAKNKYTDKQICLYQVCLLKSKDNEFSTYTTEQIIFQRDDNDWELEKEVCQNSKFIITSIDQVVDNDCEKFLRDNKDGKTIINILNDGGTVPFV